MIINFSPPTSDARVTGVSAVNSYAIIIIARALIFSEHHVIMFTVLGVSAHACE